MLVKRGFDTWKKLSILGVHSRFDVCSHWEYWDGNPSLPGVYFAKSGSGIVPLLKVLFTNICCKNCRYCSNRMSRDREQRTSFEVPELVRLTLELYNRGYIKGIFLSSATGLSSQETFIKMGEVARRLRRQGFKGYIHLKVLPGVSMDVVLFYSKFANRLSYNLEAPSEGLLSFLSREKSLGYGLEVLKGLGSFTTQFIVDYGTDRDRDYLFLLERLSRMGLIRAYFKAFEPVPHTPMESVPAGRKLREHRLYQAEFLMRRYGFKASELLCGDNLPVEVDPKLYWALRNREFFPVDVAKAEYEELLRVPGIGPKTAKRIVLLRSRGELTIEGLKRLLPFYNRSKDFLVFCGKRLGGSDDHSFRMLPLFSKTGASNL